MPFLKFSRDKRGYEHFYIVHSTTRRGRSRSRILYWFRTPPNVKVGRQPFDETLRRALEAQNPDVIFDWQSLIDTPIPPPVEPERWRERRRLGKAAKLEAQAEAAAEAEERAPDSVSRNEPVLEVPPNDLAGAQSVEPNRPSDAPQSREPGEPIEIEEENDAPRSDGEV